MVTKITKNQIKAHNKKKKKIDKVAKVFVFHALSNYCVWKTVKSLNLKYPIKFLNFNDFDLTKKIQKFSTDVLDNESNDGFYFFDDVDIMKHLNDLAVVPSLFFANTVMSQYIKNGISLGLVNYNQNFNLSSDLISKMLPYNLNVYIDQNKDRAFSDYKKGVKKGIDIVGYYKKPEDIMDRREIYRDYFNKKGFVSFMRHLKEKGLLSSLNREEKVDNYEGIYAPSFEKKMFLSDGAPEVVLLQFGRILKAKGWQIGR